jgi:choline dehydrogenase
MGARDAATFDYIVVGSGSAGAVVAARLAEDPDLRILLIEAGGRDNHPFQLMPLAFVKVAYSRRFDWAFESEPEPGLGGRRLAIPRGRTLGGCSSVNAMIAIRGNARDYDRWSEAGLEGWSHAELLPYFKRLERHWRGEGAWHGGSGPVAISPVCHPDMLWEPLREAAEAAGVAVNDDPNGERQEGICRMEATIEAGRRASTARAYLHPARTRPNLTILTRALATRVILDNGRAVGVELLRRGRLETIRAEREIVLSGGAYNTPQLLMLSGIGAPERLREAGIAVRHALPGVGENLQEHPNLLTIFKTRAAIGLTGHLRLDRAVAQVARWFLRGDGPFATNGATANLFLRTEPGLDRPDVQIIAMPLSNTAELWIPGLTAPPLYCCNLRVGALHPRSRGWVRLRSGSPTDKPRIFNNMFAEPADLDTMLRGVRAAREIFAQAPLRALCGEEIAPGAALRDDAALAEAIRAQAGHRAHPVGTCRMGTDEFAVTDATLRVRGLDGLRIADASVMPELPSGNTNLPCIMIGEKAADLLRGRKLPPERPRPR